MTDSITIVHPGLYSSIQDEGRYGYAHLGVPESGVMDKKAWRMANALINNTEQTAVIEFTMIGPTIRFDCERHFVITGGDIKAHINGTVVTTGKVYKARKGQELKCLHFTSGCRGYLAISGGIITTSVLGSQSMYAPITETSTLNKGDRIQIGEPAYGTSKGVGIKYLDRHQKLDKENIHKIEARKGPEFNVLGERHINFLKETTFSISKLWNRMAIQLEQKLVHQIPSIVTGPVVPGTVQLTPSGNIILLMRDCQTTGGYPRIIQLSEASINTLAQKKQGDQLSLLLTD